MQVTPRTAPNRWGFSHIYRYYIEISDPAPHTVEWGRVVAPFFAAESVDRGEDVGVQAGQRAGYDAEDAAERRESPPLPCHRRPVAP